MMIPRNQSDNHERTSERIHYVAGLADAVYDAIDEVPELCASTRIARIVRVLILQLQAEVERVEKAHRMEWVGLGGQSHNLSDAEIAAARGEVTPEN